MSGALSIFQKLCPSCTSSIPVDAERCDCGHVFEADGKNGASPVESALRDEELYETYLAARAAQANEAMRAAEDALAEEPDSAERISAAELAREVAGSIDADLTEQRNKIAALRKVLSSMKQSRPSAPVAKPDKPAVAAQPAPKPSKKQAPEKPAVTVRARPEIAPAAKPQAPVIQQPAIQVPAVTAKAATPAPDARVSITSLVASVAATAHKAAGALEAIKKAKALETPVQVAPLPAAPIEAAPPVTAPVEQAQPSPQTPVATTVTAPAPVATPPAAFRAEQAARAEKALEAHKKPADTKDCPNCTASVPIPTTRCRCGFVFAAGGNDLPSLTLCTGDFTALRNNFLNNLRGN